MSQRSDRPTRVSQKIMEGHTMVKKKKKEKNEGKGKCIAAGK